MDNPAAMAYACAWVAGIAIVASLAALVYELVRDWLEERREMKPVVVLVAGWCLSLVAAVCLGIWVRG